MQIHAQAWLGRPSIGRDMPAWTHGSRRSADFEPLWSEHQLEPDDEVVVHIFGNSVGVRADMNDLDITAGRDRLELLIAADDYSVWDKSGIELRHL
jgi:hypothetical protein